MSRPLDARERAEVLGIGARLLQAKYPTRRDIQFYAGIFEAGGVGVRFLARFDWPGVVVVVCARNGQEVVRSLPGRPETPAEGGAA